MKTVYNPNIKAHVSRDETGRVTHIRQSQEYWESEESIPRLSAGEYVKEMAELLQIPKTTLQDLNKKASFYNPREQGVKYQLNEEKHLFDSITVGYYQTYMNVPFWRRGLSVKIKQNPNRIVGLTNNSEEDIHGSLPDEKAIENMKRLFQQITISQLDLNGALTRGESEEDEATAFLRRTFNLKAKPASSKSKAKKEAVSVSSAHNQTRVMSGKFFVYKYIPEKRYGGKLAPVENIDLQENDVAEEVQETPIPPLPSVSDNIEAGQSYLVAEIIFKSEASGFDGLVWLMLVEVESGSILYMECMSSGVNGLVFRLDPQTKTGDLTLTSDDSNTILNPLRDDVVLPNLDAPVAGVQHLRGTYVDVEELPISHADPDIAPPTRPAGSDFDYPVRTNDFGAVNAYYHMTQLFNTIESLGFPIATYFDGTTFPIPVDHRSLGNVINAHWSPNGSGGTDHMCFALCDTTNLTEPLARAVDPWVHWHEMGGHGALGDHVGSGNLGFAHSAGDGLAALQMDPESQLRELGLPERFEYAPFHPTITRRFDRGANMWSILNIAVTNGGSGYTSSPTVSFSGGGGSGATAIVPSWGISGGSITAVLVRDRGAGYTSPPTVSFSGGGGSGATATATIGTWAWGGHLDQGGYLSEEILASCHFRIYRSIGGDHTNLGRRRFASRVVTYLILRTIGNLTPGTNPSDWNPMTMTNEPGRGAQLWCEEMQDTDLENWTSEGISGGAYNKVIRWAFEKQGSYQPMVPTSPVTTVGAPPAVDVYIDDGRAGEYDFQQIHWHNMSMWNRNSPDGLPGHQNAIEGATNYLYGKIKNRGTSTATNVNVKSYHSKPGAGLTWPGDFVEMSPLGGFTIASIGANNSEEVTVGPFEWVPNVNVHGHDCTLMIASAPGDPSNVDNFTGTETVAEWRLVPNDNNVGQRNVTLVAGGGGGEALSASMQGAMFFAGNSFNRRAAMEIQVEMPKVLAERGWRLEFSELDGNKFRLKAGEKRPIALQLVKGRTFTANDIRNAEDRNISVHLYGNDILLGGMTYYVDPDLSKPSGGKQPTGVKCNDRAQDLLQCLDFCGDQRVKEVRVKKISVDLIMRHDDCE